MKETCNLSINYGQGHTFRVPQPLFRSFGQMVNLFINLELSKYLGKLSDLCKTVRVIGLNDNPFKNVTKSNYSKFLTRFTLIIRTICFMHIVIRQDCVGCIKIRIRRSNELNFFKYKLKLDNMFRRGSSRDYR